MRPTLTALALAAMTLAPLPALAGSFGSISLPTLHFPAPQPVATTRACTGATTPCEVAR